MNEAIVEDDQWPAGVVAMVAHKSEQELANFRLNSMLVFCAGGRGPLIFPFNVAITIARLVHNSRERLALWIAPWVNEE